MTIASVIVLAVTALLAYLITGWRRAVRRLPLTWAQARKTWNAEDNQISDVKLITGCCVFFWPFILLHDIISPRMTAAVLHGDPVQYEKEIARRDARIAQLEKDNGISPSSTKEMS